MRERSRRLLVSVCACLTLSGCEFDKTSVPVGQSQVVVQSVIEPGLGPEVLVERTLSGTVTVNRRLRYDSNDPVNTLGGIPVVGATVTITGGGQTWTGGELHYPGHPSSYGAGRYVTSSQPDQGGFSVSLGVRYTLTVKSPDGVVVTGTTVVPFVRTRAEETATVFDRDRDTLRIQWSKALGARAYGLRIDSPSGAFQTFTDSTAYSIPGTLQDVFSSTFRQVFFPGETQIATLYAADTNYFDYYRSVNDPFTGSGIINKLTGGIGLFGSIVVMHIDDLIVTGDEGESIVGRTHVIAPASRDPLTAGVTRTAPGLPEFRPGVRAP